MFYELNSNVLGRIALNDASQYLIFTRALMAIRGLGLMVWGSFGFVSCGFKGPLGKQTGFKIRPPTELILCLAGWTELKRAIVTQLLQDCQADVTHCDSTETVSEPTGRRRGRISLQDNRFSP